MARTRLESPNVDYVAAGALVRIARQELGMTVGQFQVAARYSELLAVEAGRRPRPVTVARICAVLPEHWRHRIWEAYGYPGSPTRAAGYPPQLVLKRARAEMDLRAVDLSEGVSRSAGFMDYLEQGRSVSPSGVHRVARYLLPAWRLPLKYAFADRRPYDENPAGFVIRRARYDEGISTTGLTGRSQVSRAQLSHIQDGKKRWSTGSLAAICNAMPRWRSPLLIAAGYRHDPESGKMLGPIFLGEERRRHRLAISELAQRTHIPAARLRAAEAGHPLTADELSTVARELMTPVQLFLTGFDLDDREVVELRTVSKPTARSGRPSPPRGLAQARPRLVPEQVRPINRGDIIRQAREAVGMSRRGLVRSCGLAYGTLAQAEGGGRLRAQTLEQICRVFRPYWRDRIWAAYDFPSTPPDAIDFAPGQVLARVQGELQLSDEEFAARIGGDRNTAMDNLRHWRSDYPRPRPRNAIALATAMPSHWRLPFLYSCADTDPYTSNPMRTILRRLRFRRGEQTTEAAAVAGISAGLWGNLESGHSGWSVGTLDALTSAFPDWRAALLCAAGQATDPDTGERLGPALIQQERERHGLSVEELADRAGLDERLLHLAENDQAKLNSVDLWALSRELNIPDDLVFAAFEKKGYQRKLKHLAQGRKIFRDKRLALGLSGGEIAVTLGTSHRHYQMLERGGTTPSQSLLHRASQTLDLDYQELCDIYGRSHASDGGRLLRWNRLQAGLSIPELAERIGLEPAYISQVESGSQRPPALLLLAINRETGGSDTELLDTFDHPFDEDSLARLYSTVAGGEWVSETQATADRPVTEVAQRAFMRAERLELIVRKLARPKLDEMIHMAAALSRPLTDVVGAYNEPTNLRQKRLADVGAELLKAKSLIRATTNNKTLVKHIVHYRSQLDHGVIPSVNLVQRLARELEGHGWLSSPEFFIKFADLGYPQPELREIETHRTIGSFMRGLRQFHGKSRKDLVGLGLSKRELAICENNGGKPSQELLTRFLQAIGEEDFLTDESQAKICTRFGLPATENLADVRELLELTGPEFYARQRELFVRRGETELDSRQWRRINEKLAKENLALAKRVANDNTLDNHATADEYSAAGEGLAKTLIYFDPSRGEFSSYAYAIILKHVRRWHVEQKWQSGQDKYSRDRFTDAVKPIIVSLKQELGRHPTNYELAEQLGWPVSDVEDFYAPVQPQESLDTSRFADRPADRNPLLGVRHAELEEVAERASPPDAEAVQAAPERRGQRKQLRAAMARLHTDEQDLLSYVLEDFSVAWIAERLGRPEAEIAQRIGQITERLEDLVSEQPPQPDPSPPDRPPRGRLSRRPPGSAGSEHRKHPGALRRPRSRPTRPPFHLSSAIPH